MRTRLMSAAFLICALVTSNVAAYAQAQTTPGASLGLSIVANPDTGVSSLTKAQVAGIFSGTLTNWNQVGGADLSVVVIARGETTPVQTTFERAFLAGAPVLAAGGPHATAADALASVAATDGAVSFVYDADTVSASGVTIVTVSDVRATDATGVVDLGSVSASTQAGAYQVSSTASAVAPTQAGLNSIDTHSLITRDFIEENSSPLAEFTRIATIAPSVSNTGAVNGPGLSEQKLVIRGSGNDFTNVTFDGIPESDTNDPSYHSTSFFPELIVGGVDVVRGPGIASEMGYATFGGSENVYSIAPSETRSLDIGLSDGSWNTYIGSVRYQSGRQSWLGNGTLLASFQDLSSGGYLTDNNIWSRNYTVKYERPIGDKTLFDAFATWNDQSFNAADAGPGATLYELQTFGQNYSLNNNPASGECACYNYEIKTTDIVYLRLRSELGGNIHLDNRAYTYRYDNETTAADTVGETSTMAAAGAYPSQGTITCIAAAAACTAPLVAGTLAANGLQYNPTDIGGYLKRNKYIAVGDILDLTKNFGSNDDDYLRAGVWLEHSDTDRHQYSVDLTTGAYNYVDGTGCLYGGPVPGDAYQISGATPTIVAANCAASAAALPAGLKQLPGPNSGVLDNGVPIAATKFDQQSQILNAQPFVEGQYVLPSATTLYAGFKAVRVNRYDIAQIQQTSRTPESTDLIPYNFNLPFASVNQRLGPQSAFYFQYARGYEIPDLATYYVNNPTQNATTPNLSSTYQGGFIGDSKTFAWDADYYVTNFTDMQTSLHVDADGNICPSCAYTAYFDVGGAKYQGFEGEATLDIGGGFAVYGNVSSDNAKELTYNTQVANVPEWTGALGLLYKSPRFDSSIIWKQIGQQYLTAYTPATAATYNNPLDQIQPYNLIDLDFTWKSKDAVLQLNVYNIGDAQPNLTPIQTSLTSSGLMTFIAPTSYLLTFKYNLQ